MSFVPSSADTPSWSPRIWRSPESDFYRDEPLHAATVYTDKVLAGIHSHGFDAIWLRGRLMDLVHSTLLPALNSDKAAQRMASLRQVIERCQRQQMGLYLFFNEPLSLPVDHPLWKTHPQLRGEPWKDPISHVDHAALCTSTDLVRQAMQEALGQLFAGLTGLAGVILITATERQTHCWSHRIRFPLDDGYTVASDQPMVCPRCRDREPAAIVGELVHLWRDAAAAITPRPRVLVWNWSWSIWYRDPQREVIDQLPAEVELLADWERGGERPWRDGRTLTVDEYALSYAGPSNRFLATQQALPPAMPIHAKLQLGTTHEMASVPNLPLVSNLHAKFCGLHQRGVRGMMATWNFGCGLTLNSFAFGLFAQDPPSNLDAKVFYQRLAEQYFGGGDMAAMVRAWEAFGESFTHYPFAIRFLYNAPINFAPAVVLDPHYRDAPMGPSWEKHETGDRLEDALGSDFTLEQIIEAFADMVRIWDQGMVDYHQALGGVVGDALAQQHRHEELSCAAMIGSQLRSMLHIARFAMWRRDRMQAMGLKGACTLTLDDQARAILAAELENAQKALALTRMDRRLGFHQECRAWFYDADSIAGKIAHMQKSLSNPSTNRSSSHPGA